MSAIEALAKHVGSRRYARDLIERSVLTKPWWDAQLMRMTAAQEEEQRRSFVYGNCSLSNPLITRAMVDEAANRMATEGKAK